MKYIRRIIMKKLTRTLKSIGAVLLALALAITPMPGKTADVKAEPVSNFKITIEGYTGTGKITLKHVKSEEETTTKEDETSEEETTKSIKAEQTEKITNGEATFDDFVEPGEKYDIEITELIGYEDLTKKNVSDFSGSTYEIKNNELVAIDKITISGVVKNSKNEKLENVTVKFSTYEGKVKGDTTTDVNGEYDFEVYKNISFDAEYILPNSIKDDYPVNTKTETNKKYSSNQTLNQVFDIEEYKIKLEGGKANSSVYVNNTSVDDNVLVKKYENATIKVIPNTGYDLETLTVDGTTYDADELEQLTEEYGYSFKIENVKENHKFSISTKKIKIQDKYIGGNTYSEEVLSEGYTSYVYSKEEKSPRDILQNGDRKAAGTNISLTNLTDQKKYYIYGIKTVKGREIAVNYKTYQFFVDTNVPSLDSRGDGISIRVLKNDGNPFAELYHDTKFGFFYKAQVLVKVKTVDSVGAGESQASGVKKVTLQIGNSSFVDENTATPSYQKYSEDFEAEFTIPESDIFTETNGRCYINGAINVAIEDGVGNINSDNPCTNTNSNIAFNNLQIENVPPQISSKVIINKDDGEVSYEDGNKYWINKDVNIDVNCLDEPEEGVTDEKYCSGLHSVKVYAVDENDNRKEVEDYTWINNGNAKETNHNVIINTGNNTIKDSIHTNGSYEIIVESIDNAGNSKEHKIELYKDEFVPYIDKMVFTDAAGYEEDTSVDASDKVEAPKKDDDTTKEYMKKYVETGKYGYYFRKDTLVTIYASDKADSKTPSSGLESITYYCVDVDDKSEPVEEVKTVTGDDNNYIQFVLPADFKGQIFARATDNVKNTPDTYANPNGTILETNEKHKKTSGISIKPVIKNKKDLHKDAKGNDLFAKDMDVDLEVTDSYSGIRKVEWSVKSDVNNMKQSGWAKVDNAGAVSDEQEGKSCISNWTKKGDKSNLVYKLNNTFRITNNSNNIEISVKLEDRAGNKSDKTYVFSIDKTAPKLVVKMNENDDSHFTGYFKTNRKYDVYLYERNINKKQTKMKTVREDDYGYYHRKTLSTNFKRIGKTMLDGAEVYVYKKSGTFKAEGDYTFTINTKDLANNSTPNKKVKYSKEIKTKKKKTSQNTQQSNTQQGTTKTNNKVNADNNKILDYKKQNNKDKGIDTSFTIDKTTPKVTVTYDNNNAVNGKYFPQARTATIKINEHNFTKENNRIVINKKATRDGSSIGGATMSSWAHKIDTNLYRATIPYTEDGDYQFGIDVTDKAGNKVSDSGVNYPNGRDLSKDFVIDQSVEKPIIGGVENGKSYPEKCIPTVQVNDTNYESSEVKLLRTQKDDIDRDVTSKYIKSMPANGSTVSEDYFDKLKANDGIYKLSVNITDMAGNTDSEEVAFTVNRFGSVYEFSKDLVALQDSYVNKVDGDIFIREFNPDRLVEDSVELEVQRDQDPVENVKYDVSPEVNKKVDIGSSGWYQYKYDIGNDNFKKDGIYTVNVKTKDDAGNTPESNNQSEIRFSVDTEKPDIVNVKGLENSSVNAKEQKVNYLIHDSIGLKSIVATVDGKEVAKITEFTDPTNYEGDFTIKEGFQRKVNFKITDLAGNVTNTADTDFNPEYDFNSTITVSTNIFLLWFANKLLFFGSLIALAAIAAAIAYFVRKKRALKNIIK